MSAGRKRGRRGGGSALLPLAVILILLVCAATVSIFFRVAEVNVSGVSHYSRDEVVTASGIKNGDIMVLVSRGKAEKAIIRAFPYIDEVTIEKKYPASVVITVTERVPAGYIRSGSDCWIIDMNGYILEKSTAVGSLAEITGIEPLVPDVGEKIAVSASETLKLENVISLMKAACDKGVLGKIISIDASMAASMTMRYDGRFNVKLGDGEDLKDKLSLMKEIIASLSENASGMINVTDLSRGSYLPQ